MAIIEDLYAGNKENLVFFYDFCRFHFDQKGPISKFL